MKKIRALVVDDEPLARGRVRMLLEPHGDFEIVGEAGDGEVALERIEKLTPDLLFLDIQMPGVGGLELIEKLGDERPVVVFLTAYDQYAVDAFDASALDYVLKPIDPERFDRTVERIRSAFSSQEQWEDARLAVERLLQERALGGRPRRFIVRKAKGRRLVVEVEDILWVSAERNYVRLHTKDGAHLLRETMNRMEELLDPEAFVRIHRSTIVRIEAVKVIDSESDGSYYITMGSGARLSVGSAYRENLERALGQRL